MRGYLLVAVLGFALGTLCAQKKGAELRKEIKDSFCDLRKNGAEALEVVQRKSGEIVDKASPAVAQVKEEAKGLRDETNKVFKKAADSIKDKALAAMEQMELKYKELIGKTSSTTDDQKFKLTQAGKGCMEVVKAPGSPLYEVKEGRAATQ